MRGSESKRAAVVNWLRQAANLTLALIGLVVIVAVLSAIRDSRPRVRATPAPVPVPPTEAAAACRMYEVMKTRLDTVARISDVIPPGELLTAERRQEFEKRRDDAKREAAKRTLRALIRQGSSGSSRTESPGHPYFDEIAITALNRRTTGKAACQSIREDVGYLHSVQRVYRNYLEAQRANGADPQRSLP